jgi:hypothetical protein
VRSTISYIVVICGLFIAAGGRIDAQGTRAGTAFEPERRLFTRLFTAARLRVRRPPARTVERERPANRQCDGCEHRPGTAHLVLDSPRLTDAWLAHHTYQANGGSFGDNLAVADFWYDAVHRRLFSRSLVLHEVDDPADLRLGRAPGTYPHDIDPGATLDADTTVGHIGFVSWTHNGFGSYFAAIQGAVRDSGTGYLDLVTATGMEGRTRSGSSYDPQDLVKHVRLHPSGQLEIGFDTDPDARPAASLLVRGDARVAGGLSVGGVLQTGELTTDRVATGALTIAAGRVPHACSLQSATGTRNEATVSCNPGHIALSGGGRCASGELRASHPTQSGDEPDGWALTCSRNGAHTAYVVCCAQ